MAVRSAQLASGGYGLSQTFRNEQYIVGAYGAALFALGLAAAAGEAPEVFAKASSSPPSNGVSQGGAYAHKVAGDAPSSEPELQPGDRGWKEKISEGLRGGQIRATLAKYQDNIDAAAREFGVDPQLIRGIIVEEQVHLWPLVESGSAESLGYGKTVGLGQVTEGLHGFTRAQLLDPATNIRAIATHLSYLKGQPLISPSAPLSSVGTNYNCGSCSAITAYGRRVVFYGSRF